MTLRPHLARALMMGMAAIAACSPATPSERSGGTVTNQAELIAALESASGGDVIELAAGDYGDLFVRNMTFDSPVAIVSAPGAEAHFDTVRVLHVQNLTFRSIDVGRPLEAGEPNHLPWFVVGRSKAISFDSVHIHGSLDGNAKNDGYGLQIRDSENIVVANSEFEQLTRGMQVLNSVDVEVVNNDFHDLMVDGVDFWQARSIVVDNNRFRDFYSNGVNHPDAIQFFATNATISSSDIRITNNEILQGEGDPIQGIFIRDETGVTPYRNVHISNNLVYMGGSWNGISLNHAENVDIINNSVLSPTSDTFELRIWFHNVSDARVVGNVADVYAGANASAEFRANVFLKQSPAFRSNLPNLDVGPAAGAIGLLVDGVGYRPRSADAPIDAPPE